MKTPLLIIGGGPAGMAAAIEAAKAGLACTLLDEAPRVGGQIFRQPPREFRLAGTQQRDRDLCRGDSLRTEFAAVAERVELRSNTTVLGIEGRDIVWASGEASGTLAADQLVIAGGAYERPVPFPGWTLPGAMTVGGAQSLVKTMHIRPGNRALIAGTGPLLLVAANQLHAAGVEIVAVLEAGRPTWSPRVLPKIWGEWQLLRDAWDYWRGLRRAGIPILFNHTVFEAHGIEAVNTVSYGPIDPVTWRPIHARSRRVDVDLLVTGFGLVPNTSLSELAGCRHEYIHKVGGWVPVRSAHMETSVPGIFAVGDGAGVAGAIVAIHQGRIAGITAAEHAGLLSTADADRKRVPLIERLRSLAQVRGLLDEMSWIRPGLCELATPPTFACRCEEVSIAEVDVALQQGAQDLQAVKLLTRLGMGPCQGRNCAPSMSMYLGTKLGCSPSDAGRIQPRMPIKPVTLGVMAGLNERQTCSPATVSAHGGVK